MAAPHPVAQRRAAATVAAAVGLAFEPARPGRRVEAEPGADMTVAGGGEVPEVLREDQEGLRTARRLPSWIVPGRAGCRERTGRGENAALAADQGAERGRGAGGPEQGVVRLAFRFEGHQVLEAPRAS